MRTYRHTFYTQCIETVPSDRRPDSWPRQVFEEWQEEEEAEKTTAEKSRRHLGAGVLFPGKETKFQLKL